MKYIFSLKNLLFQNATTQQTIVKNTVWLSFSTVINKLLALALLIYAARILGVEGYGQFTFALAFASLLTIFSDFGLSAIVTREFVHNEVKREELYSLFSLKILLAAVTFLLILLAAFFALPDQRLQGIVIILGIFLVTNSLIGLFDSFFHALQRMEYEAWFEMLQSVLVVLFGFFVLFRFPSPGYLGYAYVLAGGITLVSELVFFHCKIFPLRIQWDTAIWKKFLTMSWPLALIGLFGMVYSYTDSVMLGYFGLVKETGWYNAAYKIITASLLPMGFIGAAFYPVLSKFSKGSQEKLQTALIMELEIMIALALPLVVGGIMLAPSLIYAIYSVEFAPSILAFQILLAATGLIFLYRPLNDVLIVLNQQRRTFTITMIGALVNIGLNLLLIPKYGLYGAAAATVVTHALMLAGLGFFVKRYTSLIFPVVRMGGAFVLAGIAAFFMYLGLQQASLYTQSPILLAAAGASIYLVIFFFLRQYLFKPYLYIDV